VPPAVRKMSSVESLYGRSLDRCSARALLYYLKQQKRIQYSYKDVFKILNVNRLHQPVNNKHARIYEKVELLIEGH
jgi:hypothetical protein